MQTVSVRSTSRCMLSGKARKTGLTLSNLKPCLHGCLARTRHVGVRHLQHPLVATAGCRATTKVNFKDTDAVDEFLQSIPEADQAVLHRAAAAWQRLCTQGPPAPPHVATSRPGPAPRGAASDAYDVVVLGGTLGILLATALLAHQQQQPGAAPLRVAVVERGKLQGRQQEWNASHSDLQVLVELGLLQPHEVEEAVATRFSSVRVGVAGRAELSLQGVMDCGVCPATLLALLARRFTALGGVLLEDTAFSQLDVYDDTALLILAPAAAQQQHAAAAAPNNSSEAGGAGGRGAAFELPTDAERTPAGSSGSAGSSSSSSSSAVVVSARLVLDALGGLSPLSAQARAGSRPEAAMLLVGSCVEGPGQQAASSSSSSADVLWGWTPLDRAACQQYWWERFPAQGGAATSSYMFAFTDPDPANAGLLQHMARQYAAQLPTYLGVPPGSLAVQRGVFGVVPCYSSRTPPLVDRLLPVADAAGNRSALSLAGFCALLRHLPRLTRGIREALAAGALSKQELGLLQPWCPGVAASTAMQRTMAVYSCQAPTIRGSSSSSSAQPGRSSSNSSAAVSGSEVLDMMGASFSAMWGAVGAAGMAPFVADRLQWGPLAAGMAAQARADLPQLLSYSRFLNDTRSAPRLLAGLAGLAAYSALHAATPLTGPLHEALLSRLSPRLLYAWHRYADAWRYGSGADWAPAVAAAAAAADTGAAPSGARDVTHSVDTYEDSLLPPAGYEGADADDALCRPDSPLCNDAMHSVDSTEVIDWPLEAGQGWGQHSSGSKSGSGVAAACSSGCSSGSSRPASKQAAVWGGSVLPAVHCSSSSRSQMLRARPVAMAASNGSSSSSGDSGSSSGGDKNAALHRQQRRALEQLLLSIVVHEEHGRHQSTGESRDVVSIAEPGPGGDVSHYEGADAARLLYPQLDPARSYDEYDVIDWSDVANDGWGSSSTSGSGGSRRQCCNTRPAGSSSSSSSRMNPVAWGGSMCRAGWLPGTTSSRQQQRRVAAAAAAGGAGGNSNAAHSVDTYEDSLLPPGGYEGADAADDALCRPDSPLCEDPGHSVDSTEVINWEREAGQGSTSSTRAAAAAASASNRSAAKDATHSVDTYEDSLLPPGGYEGADADDALCRPDSPLCEDPGHSVDSTEVQDWSSQPNQGFGSSKSSTTAAAAGSGSSAGMPAGHAAHSVDTYEDSLLPPGGYEGADAADDALCRPDSPLCEDPGHSVDSTEIIDWSAQRSSSSRGPVVAAAAADSSASNAGRDATHSVDTYEDSLLPPGGYEGADADDALCRPDSPLCNDAMHSVDSTEVIDWADEPSSSRGQQQEAATSAAAAGSASSSSTAAAAEPGTASATSSLPADPSYRKKHDGGQQQQQQVAAPRPWMNIVGGRWVPPSREESEAMMRGSVEVGPDEGV